jgi:hypothetical protein
MPEEKREMNILGVKRTVTDVPISKAVEMFSEYELEDGSVIRVKSVATAILRIDGEFTGEGKPIYIILTMPNTYVISSKIHAPPTSPLVEK